ncbi:unnamed protein product [Strongylus vulgaris]|uniref:Uncharacterized protein n=1 Tax=Strongylus vulgaris TaxID=40348 RepID=A0A3P7JKA8_STRVU|nr:unnamed protein product [Strongylus vulgaris]
MANNGELITNPMFKSNLWKTLSALPAAGVLGAGEHDQVDIAIADNFSREGKVEFAYAYVDDSIEQFNKKIYSDSQKRTHRLIVVFQ